MEAILPFEKVLVTSLSIPSWVRTIYMLLEQTGETTAQFSFSDKPYTPCLGE